jgi:hypothetical protein
MKRAFAILVVLGIATGAACSSTPLAATVGVGQDGGVEGGAGSGSDAATTYPAPHPDMPQAQSVNGPVMKAPKVVAITFQGDPLQASVDGFITQLVGATSYWSGATAEYGVGPLTAAPPVHVAEAAGTNLTDADVQAWLTSKINAGGDFPAPDANTLYAIFYPDGTTVSDSGAALCHEFQGYHSNYSLAPGKLVAYAIIGRCPPPLKGLPEMDEVSAEASHEIVEGATDPFPKDNPAWTDIDRDHGGWALVGGGAELGDLCAPFPNAFFKPSGVSNLVARIWSNKAAAAGHDPCEPQGESPYFNSAPVLDDPIEVIDSPVGSFKTKGVSIPVGSSKTVELDLYSDAPTSGPWKVSVLDLTSAFFGGPEALSFTLDASEGKNGDKLHLTIKSLAKSPLGAAPFWVQNELGESITVWIGLVGN